MIVQAEKKHSNRVVRAACLSPLLRALVLPLLLSFATDLQADRIALVIGNGAYDSQSGWNPLANPSSDAAAVARILRDTLDFDHVLEYRDLDRAAMIDALDRFGQLLNPGDTGFFFYSGHGAQADQNYLIPTDAKYPSSQVRLSGQSLALKQVLSVLETNRTSLNIVVLDACRDNPLTQATKGFGQGGLKGLQRTDLGDESETLIAFAAAPNRPAREGTGALSPYTDALIRELARPQHLWSLFGAVSSRVRTATNGFQIPWKNDNLSEERFLMLPGPDTAPPPRPADPIAAERALRLDLGERGLVQRWLAALGHDPHGVDGAFGPNTRSTIAAWQRAAGRHDSGYLTAADYSTLRTQAEASLGKRYCNIAPEMTPLNDGCYQMGSPANEQGRQDDERRHNVCVDAFSIGRYEVTWSQWEAVMGHDEDPHHCPNCPVDWVSQSQAELFVQMLNQCTNKRYRLPTEAEWEYAARAGTSTTRYWGDNFSRSCIYANSADSWLEDICPSRASNDFSSECFVTHQRDCDDGYYGPAPVGSFRPNPWGLYDMLGNVSERTGSRYDADYGGAEQRGLPPEAVAWDEQVMRGGNYKLGPDGIRAAYRGRVSFRDEGVGMRLAHD